MALEHGTTLWGIDVNKSVVFYLEKGLAWAVIATVFFLPISEALKNICYVVSLVLYLVVTFLIIDRERIAVPPVGWLLLSFLGAAILSAAASPYPGSAITGVWDVFRPTSFFFIVERGMRDGRHMKAAVWTVVTGLGLTALFTLCRYFVFGVPRIDALSLGGNETTALYAVMGLALMFGMYVHSRVAGFPLVWLITVAGLSVMLLGLTHVRMLWGGFILIALILGWLRSARLAVTAVAISILLVLGVGVVTPDVRNQIVSLGNIEAYKTMGEGGVRLELWKKAIAMWRDAPWLGFGPRTFNLHDEIAQSVQRDRHLFRQGNPHSLYLQTAVEMGTVGLVVLVVMFGYIGVWLIRCRRCFPSSWPAAVWDGAFGSCLAILIGGVTEPSFGRETAMLFFMLLALVQVGVADGKRGAVATERQTP